MMEWGELIDLLADKKEVKKEYGINLCNKVKKCDCLVFAVAHEIFKNYSLEEKEKYYVKGKKIIIDIKGVFRRIDIPKRRY